MQPQSLYFLVFFLFQLSESVFSEATDSNSESNTSEVNPQIYSMQVHTNVSNRFATTLITSKIRNVKDKPEETNFAVILPVNAFISEFEMEVNGKIYKAYVKGKKEARQTYREAVVTGQGAARVELSARDSKIFILSVNIEPESETIFRLRYEELLQRQIGQYELVINIRPGQTVEDLGVQVHINESKPLAFVRTPSLRTGNGIGRNDERLDPSAQIDIIDKTSATVKFNPSVSEQKKFARYLGGVQEKGLVGQFVVQYDVERDPQGGEVLLRDGYFVHFFSPSDLPPLPKHVVFVLDHSGNMSGRKFDQLAQAMKRILSELNPEDLFHILRFSTDVSLWSEAQDKFINIETISKQYGHLESYLRELNLPQASEVTQENLNNVRRIINDQTRMLLTNMIAGLEVGLFLTKRTQEKFPNKYQSMIIFLTAGVPSVGMNSTEVKKTVTKINSGTKRAAIFSLSFGDKADKDFLRKLSLQNCGFSRHIYEASDASLQIQEFYRTISSPILNDIKFSYADGVSQVTNTHYPILLKGSELVVAGRTTDDPNVLGNIVGIRGTDPKSFNATCTEAVTSLERLWAYLTVKQLLRENDAVTNTTELNKKAFDLALKYSFVTPVTSMFVLKPNQTDSVDTKIHPPSSSDDGMSYPAGTGARRVQKNHFIKFGRGGAYYDTAPAAYPSFLSSRDTLPQWLARLKANNETIITAHGSFKLGRKGTVVTRPDCPKTPLNDTGVCTIIFDCPQVFSLLTDLNTYLQYFCPLNEYAGVCCPVVIA